MTDVGTFNTRQGKQTADLPSVVGLAENHAAFGVAGLADFPQYHLAIRALEAANVPVLIHR